MNVATLVLASAISLAGNSDVSQRECMVHDHQPVQVRRMPITPATTSKPRNPLEDETVHCETRNLATGQSFESEPTRRSKVRSFHRNQTK